MSRATTSGTAPAGSLAGEEHARASATSACTTAVVAQAAAQVRGAARCSSNRVVRALGHTAEQMGVAVATFICKKATWEGWPPRHKASAV